MPLDESHEDYEKAARRLLVLLIRVTGWTQRRLDRQLGYSVGYVSRLLTGNTKLLYTHILEILKAIGVEPARFFEVLHPDTSPQHLLEVLERAHRIRDAAEKDPAGIPVAERVGLALDRFRVEYGARRVRGGAHDRSRGTRGP
jgi:transcriptional regulator with XRE-family HTH domain